MINMLNDRHLPSYTSLATDEDEGAHTSPLIQRNGTLDVEYGQSILPPSYDDIESELYNEEDEDRSTVRPKPKRLSTAQYAYGKRLQNTNILVYIALLFWALLSSALAVLSLFVTWVNIDNRPYLMTDVVTSSAYGGVRLSFMLGMMCWAWIMQVFGVLVTGLFLTARRNCISIRLALILHFMAVASAFIAFILYSFSLVVFHTHMTAWAKEGNEDVVYGMGLVLMAFTTAASFLHFLFGIGTLFGVNITLQLPSESPLYIPMMRSTEEYDVLETTSPVPIDDSVVAPVGTPA